MHFQLYLNNSYPEWELINYRNGRIVLKNEKIDRKNWIILLKIYVYYNFLMFFLVFDINSIYLCNIFSYQQELICSKYPFI